MQPPNADTPYVYPQHPSKISVSYIANHLMRCLKTNGPLGFNPNEPFAGASKRQRREQSRIQLSRRIQLGRLIGSAPYFAGDPFALDEAIAIASTVVNCE